MAKEWSGQERRKYKRTPLQFIITFNIYEPRRVRILAGDQEYYGMITPSCQVSTTIMEMGHLQILMLDY